MDVGGRMAMAGHKEEGGSKCTGTSCLDTQHPRKRTPDPADPNNHLGRPGGANLWSYYSLFTVASYIFTYHMRYCNVAIVALFVLN